MKKLLKKIFLPIFLVCSTTFAVLGITFLKVGKVYAQTTIKEETIDSFKINESASVRLSAPDGIRFTTTVDEDTRSFADELKDKGYAVSYGALLCPTKLLGNSELTFGSMSASALDIPTEKWVEEGVSYNSVLSGSTDVNGNITNMPTSFYNRPISARGYMKATKNDETLYYYTANVAERSLGYVAAMSILNGTTTDQIKKYAENTVFGFVDDLILTTNQSNEGALLSNVYKSSSSEYALFTLDGIPAFLKNVQISVEDDEIASVTNGVVTAKSNGTTTLTAVYNVDGIEKTISGTLTVSDEFKGESKYSILIPANATEKVTSAAKKFQSIFKESTNVTLPIVIETGREKTTGKYVSVGETALAKKSFDLTVKESTASEIKTLGNVLFVRGVSDNGTLYGVQKLLGEIAGYEFYLKDTYSVSVANSALDLPSDKNYVPDIEYNFLDQNSDVNADYAMQMFYEGLGRVNGITEYLHNSILVLNPDTYYASNNNWYATKKKFVLSSLKTENVLITTNQGKAAELCYTAHGDSAAYQSMLDTVADALIKTFKANPSVEKISFSISDGNYGWCDCNACAAAGNAADNLLNFLNALCQKVESGLAGDSRQNTFKVLTLAYHQTNVAPTKVTSVNKHIEVWFGDSYGDYTKGLNETGSGKNAEIYENFQGWAELIGDADMLLWTYYSNTKCGFAPYNTFTAMRKNYAMAKEAGVDYVFNQTIQARSVWTMLKLYLASELKWNANPTDAEWESWIDSYFNAAYGQGAAKMREWFNEWQSEDVSAYASSDSDPAIHRNIVNSTYFPKESLEKWIDYANAAVSALDKNDKNYTKYYNNIMLEKISPEYLLIEIYGDYGTNMVYASDFVHASQTWNITNVGEVTSIDGTLEKYQQALADKTITVETEFYAEKQTDDNYTVVIEDANITGGDYNVTVGGATVVSATAESGKLTVTISGVTEGKTCTLTATDTAADGNITKFTNVIAVTKAIRTFKDLSVFAEGSAERTANITGYYVLANDIDAKGERVSSGYKWDGYGFAGTFDGRGRTISDIKAGTTGIFGQIQGGNIKNINFTDVTICNEWGAALFAVIMNNSILGNVSVTYKEILADDTTVCGLLMSRVTAGNYTNWQNVTLDARGLHVPCLFGSQATLTGTYVVFKDVTIYADSYNAIAYTDSGTTTKITELPSGVTYVDTLPEIEVDGEFVAEDGALELTHEGFIGGAAVKVTINGTTNTETIVNDGQLTVDLRAYGVTANGNYTVYVNVGDYSINFVNVTANFPLAFSVTLPTSAYYTFDGNDEAKQGKSYSFAINPTNADLNDFVVFVNDEKVECTDGRYTVENVQGNLTIKVLHGYIIVASGKTVEYNGATIKITNSTGVGQAYISEDYLTYMKSIGYTSVKFRLAPDGNIAVQSCVQYDGKLIMKTDVAGTDIEYDLSDVSSVLEFWGQNAAGSGYQIRDLGSYLTITDLRFVKSAQSVTVSEETYAEVGNEALLVSDKFVVGDEYTVTANGESVKATVTEATKLSVLFTTLAAGNSYTAICEGENYKITFSNVFAVTKVIRTANDLSGLATINSQATTDITGYYVLGGNIDASGYTTIATGYNWNNGFKGTFDGRGYTVDGITALTCGLFGTIKGGEIKDVNFTNVTLGSGRENYAALFAGICSNLTMNNVNISYKAINLVQNYGGTDYLHGLLFSRVTNGKQNWKNVTIDASDFVVDSIFGAQAETFSNVNSNFVNVTVKVKEGSVLGYTSSNKNTPITTLPSGITVEKV